MTWYVRSVDYPGLELKENFNDFDFIKLENLITNILNTFIDNFKVLNKTELHFEYWPEKSPIIPKIGLRGYVKIKLDPYKFNMGYLEIL